MGLFYIQHTPISFPHISSNSIFWSSFRGAEFLGNALLLSHSECGIIADIVLTRYRTIYVRY